jgi:hypothetical protein
MLGAAMGGIGGRRVGRAAIAGLTLLVAACGDDKGPPFSMPPGVEFDTTRADRVLVVVESQNMCGDIGDCVPVNPGPCHLGDGNVRGLAVYRLGPSGRLFSPTGERGGALPEQVIPTDDNPRRIAVHPNDSTLFYVATEERIQVFRLSAGGTTCIDETISEDEFEPGENRDELDAVDLLVDPAFGPNGVLYVAAQGASRVDAYEIAADGTLPPVPSSCIVGPSEAEFAAITPMTAGLFGTGSRDRIEVYTRVGGHFPDVQNPSPTPTPSPQEQPTASPPPDPNVPTTTASPTPAPRCIDATRITEPISDLGAGFVTDMEFFPSLTEPIGSLVITEEASRRLTSFPVDAAGEIDDDENGQTDRAGLYQRMLVAVRGGVTFIYSSVFQEGRTDVFRLRDDGSLPGPNLAKTRSDPFSLPVGIAMDGDEGPILYVAQEGLGRADGFLIREDGGIDSVPATSTAPTRRLNGAEINTFPDDVAVVPLP